MCIVLLPSGVNPIAVNKYVGINKNTTEQVNCTYNLYILYA
jgi:hypothetical protein